MADLSRGDWIQTFTGKQFFPMDPRPEDICIEDIAHALSMTCRYAGHCKRFYSVAEHSVHVANHMADPEHRLVALLHDASEAYIADIARPIKPMIEGYKPLEAKIEKAIAEKFGLTFPMPPEVKEIDNRILWDERDALMEVPPRPWTMYGAPLGIPKWSFGWSPDAAERIFLDTFRRYTND